MSKFLLLEHANLTLFRKSVFADVNKGSQIRSSWIRVGLISRVLTGDTEGRNPCEYGAEITVMLKQGKEHQGTPEARRRMENFSPRIFRENTNLPTA